MYQVKDDRVVNQLFDPDSIPRGWYDSPKAAKAAKVKQDAKAAKATNVGLMVNKDGDSARLN